jgi:HEAT repeat protein
MPNATVPAAVEDFITKIKSADDKVRGPAWQGAATAGPAAIAPLAALLDAPSFEVARAAKRALYLIIRHAGRPGAKSEMAATEKALVPLLQNPSVIVRREGLWLLSEIGGDRAVAPMFAQLSDPQTREDARCALVRLPGAKATTALKSAFASAPEDFKYALADALRQRGEKVTGYPSRKLVPTKATTVGVPAKG